MMLLCFKLHKSGVYVFESKNYHGWIYGGEYQKKWTQTLPGRRGFTHKEHFMNPIAQNELHLKWLKEVLHDDSIPVYSYIVFGSECRLKNIKVRNPNYHVVQIDDLFIDVFSNSDKVKSTMSDEQIDAVYSKLSKYTMVDDSVKRAHIENLRRKKNGFREEKSVSENICETKSLDEDHDAETAESVVIEHPIVETKSDNVAVSESETVDEKKNEQSSPEITTGEPTAKEAVCDANICPYCGSRLVIRRATKGKNKGRIFWGCSAFPKCWYTKEIPVVEPDKNDSRG